MDRKSKVFFALLTVALLASIGCSFYRYVVLGDYETFTDPDNVPTTWDIFNINS